MTADIPFIPSMRPEPKRDRYSRYLLPDPATGQERAWTRATTVAHTLSDTYALTQWKRRMVAEGMAVQPELLEKIPALARQIADASDWREAKAAKAALDGICDEAARAAGAEDGSKLGTLLHTITEYDDAGRYADIENSVPEQLKPDLQAYRAAMSAARVERPAEYIERIVINTEIESGGTFDRLLRLPDGRLVVGDLKTQKTLEFGFLEIAIQLAEYANADAMYDADTGQLGPLPAELDKTVGIVMHLPVGQATCTLWELDLAAGWHAAKVAHETRRLRSASKAMGWPYRPRTVSTTGGDRVLFLINSAQHPDALVGLWRDLASRGAWTPEYNAAAARRKAELLMAA
jgi:hypothetical protein